MAKDIALSRATNSSSPMARPAYNRSCWPISLLLLLCFGLLSFPIHAQTALLHKPAPLFVRTDLKGQRVDLRALRGKVVLLNFWASWCGPCQVELPAFQSWQRQYGASGLQVITVAMDDDTPPVTAVVKKLQLNLPVVMGDDRLGKEYGGILGLPITFLISRNGILVERVEGAANLSRLEMDVRALLSEQ